MRGILGDFSRNVAFDEVAAEPNSLIAAVRSFSEGLTPALAKSIDKISRHHRVQISRGEARTLHKVGRERLFVILKRLLPTALINYGAVADRLHVRFELAQSERHRRARQVSVSRFIQYADAVNDASVCRPSKLKLRFPGLKV